MVDKDKDDANIKVILERLYSIRSSLLEQVAANINDFTDEDMVDIANGFMGMAEKIAVLEAMLAPLYVVQPKNQNEKDFWEEIGKMRGRKQQVWY